MKSKSHSLTKNAWNLNAAIWDSVMGMEGNDFFRQLQLPFILEYLGLESSQTLEGKKVLDMACGNGILARKLVNLGALVIGVDFSEELIKLAESYSPKNEKLSYYVVDLTCQEELIPFMDRSFDIVICNMALFDISDIEILAQAMPQIVKPAGMFVFSLTHPAFNNSSTIKMVEEFDQGKVIQKYSLKTDKYLSIYEQKGIAVRGQKNPQFYYNRPLSYYFKLFFNQGFVLDRFDEPEFLQAGSKSTLSWGFNFREFPPVMLARMKLLGGE